MEQDNLSSFGAKITDKGTRSFIYFSQEIEQTEFLMFFILIGDSYIGENKEDARQLLIEIYDNESVNTSKEMVAFLKTENADELFDMMFYEKHFSQMAFTRSIDNFITYFKDILAEIVIKRPQVLKSKDQERLDFILDHKDMDELLKAISEKKIEELFYRGIADIERFFMDRLGINIFKKDDDRRTISMLIQQRNLIVHSRGKISKRHAEEFPEANYPVGGYLYFQYEKISKLNLFLHNFVIDLDSEISEKFGLEIVRAGNSERSSS